MNNIASSAPNTAVRSGRTWSTLASGWKVVIVLVILLAIAIGATFLTLYFLHKEGDKTTTTTQPSSGVVLLTGVNRPISQWQRYPGQVPDPANQTQLATFPSLSAEQCAAKCRTMSSCGAFASNNNTSQCTIYAGANIFDYSPYVTTYIVPSS